jgi:predicted DNA-binding antitoxin AbrB/MazE fold protein
VHALKARVENGRLRLDEPTDLPEGKEVAVVVVEDDGLSDADRERLMKMIDESLADAAAGDVESFSKVIAELRTQL